MEAVVPPNPKAASSCPTCAREAVLLVDEIGVHGGRVLGHGHVVGEGQLAEGAADRGRFIPVASLAMDFKQLEM
jgi:hypothetical protein